jgi:hypothetical protein
MTRRTIALLTLLALATVAFLPSPVSAAATGVTKLTAKKSGSVVTVSGSATFVGEKVNVVSTDDPGDGAPAETGLSPLGVEMIAAHVYTPDPKTGSVVFEWKIGPPGLPPPTGGIPEINRYIWAIKVTSGSKSAEYVLQAKFTNIVTSNLPDDPPGHLSHIGNAFQVRGNCGAITGPGGASVSTCEHLGWVEGAFDTENDVVRILLPLGLEFMPELVAGASISPFEFALAQISACHSAGVSNAFTCDDAVWSKFKPYLIGRTVYLGIAKRGTPISKVKFATSTKVTPAGAFSGAIKPAGLKGPVDVWARACVGATCAFKKMTITV